MVEGCRGSGRDREGGESTSGQVGQDNIIELCVFCAEGI